MNTTEKWNELWEMLHGDTDTIELTDNFLEVKCRYFKNRVDIYNECCSVLDYFSYKEKLSLGVKWGVFRKFVSFSDREMEMLSKEKKEKYIEAVTEGFSKAIEDEGNLINCIYTKESEYKKIRLINIMSANPTTYRVMKDEIFEIINRMRVQDFKTLISYIVYGDGAETWCKKFINVQAERVFEIKKMYPEFVINDDMDGVLLRYYQLLFEQGEIKESDKGNYALVEGVMYRGFSVKEINKHTIYELSRIMEDSLHFAHTEKIKKLIPKEEFQDIERKIMYFLKCIIERKEEFSNDRKSLLKGTVEKVMRRRKDEENETENI